MLGKRFRQPTMPCSVHRAMWLAAHASGIDTCLRQRHVSSDLCLASHICIVLSVCGFLAALFGLCSQCPAASLMCACPLHARFRQAQATIAFTSSRGLRHMPLLARYVMQTSGAMRHVAQASIANAATQLKLGGPSWSHMGATSYPTHPNHKQAQ